MKHSSNVLLVLLVVALAFGSFVGCSKDESTTMPPSGQQELLMSVIASDVPESDGDPEQAHGKTLMDDTEIVGTATGIAPDGNPAVMVLLKSDARSTAFRRASTACRSSRG